MRYRGLVLAAVALVGLAVGSPCFAGQAAWEPGQTWTYDFTMADVWFGENENALTQIKDTTGKVVLQMRSRTLIDQGKLGAAGKLEFVATCTFAPDGTPLAYDFRAAVAADSQFLHGTFAAGKFTGYYLNAAGKKEIAVDLPKGAFMVGDNNVIGHFAYFLAGKSLKVGDTLTTGLFVPQVLQSLSVSFIAEQQVDITCNGVEVTALRVKSIPLGEDFYLDKKGRLIRVEVPAQKLRIDLRPPAKTSSAKTEAAPNF